jgi:hypothetical protein
MSAVRLGGLDVDVAAIVLGLQPRYNADASLISEFMRDPYELNIESLNFECVRRAVTIDAIDFDFDTQDHGYVFPKPLLP